MDSIEPFLGKMLFCCAAHASVWAGASHCERRRSNGQPERSLAPLPRPLPPRKKPISGVVAPPGASPVPGSPVLVIRSGSILLKKDFEGVSEQH
jgi:hypothetical protein